MKKTILLSIICCAFTAVCYSNTFGSFVTGNWNNTATWIDLQGDDPDGIPDANDDVIFGDGVTVTCTSSVACLTIVFDFNLSGTGLEARLNIGSGGTVTVSGTVTIQDGFSASEIANIFLSSASGVLDMNGDLVFSATAVGKARITYSVGATVRLAGNITNTNGTIITSGFGVTGTFMLDGAAAQTLMFNGNDFTYPSIIINNSAASPTAVSLNGNITTTNLKRNLTIQDGILLAGANTITGNAYTFTLQAGCELNTAGTFPTGFTTYTLNAASTVEYSGTGAQTISAENYGNLTSSSTGARTLASSGTIGVAGTFTAGTNSYTVTGSTVNFNGTAPQTIATAFTFNNLSINNASGVSLGANVDLTGTLTLTNGILTTTGQIFTLISNGSGTARIGNIPGAGSITGNIVMQRLIPAVPDWRILSPSVAGSTIADWNGEISMSCITGTDHTTPHFTSVYTYNETVGGTSDNGFSADDDPGPAGVSLGDALTTGTGYMMWVGTCLPPCAPTTITTNLTGTLVKGTQTISCSFTASAGDANDGWNMIGNPFPSDFSWDAAASTGGVTGIAYVYDPASSGYLELNRALPSDRDVIPSQQGFFAKASGTAGTVVIEEADKVADGMNFLKVGDNPPGFILTLDGNGFLDITEFYFLAGANENYDAPIDALKLNSLNYLAPNFSSVSADSIDLAQNFLPELIQDYSIPLRINWTWPGGANSYTISANDLSSVPLSTCVLLEDTATGTFTNLRTDTSYAFTMTADTGLLPRFILHLGAPATTQSTAVSCNGFNDGIAIAGGQGTGPWNYVWLNSNGDTVKISSNLASADTLSGLAADTYTVYVTNSGGLCNTISDAIVINEPSAITVNGVITGVTCNGNGNGAIDITPTGGTPPYSYSWSTGDTIEDLVNLGGNTYTLSIYDAKNCMGSDVFNVAEPAPVIAGINILTDSVYLSQGGNLQFTNTSSGATSYTWNFGDGSPVSAMSDPLHTFNTTGTFTVSLTAANVNNCADTVYRQVYVSDSNIGISEPEEMGGKIKIMQDENGAYIDFNFNETIRVNISVFDILGQKIFPDKSTAVYKDRVPVYLTQKLHGVYFIRVAADRFIMTEKIIY